MIASDEYPRFHPLGDSAVMVEFGDRIDKHLNQRAIGLANFLDERPFPGYVESVPAYASTTVFYQPSEVRKAFIAYRSAYDAVLSLVKPAANAASDIGGTESDLIVIPVDFSAKAGLDLEHVAVGARMTVDEVISLFTSATYHVYMLGFLPGFPYMGEVDPRIATSRKDAPRAAVPRGSVGIAGRQTGIYPFDSPGGWQIVGRTDLDMFRPKADVPCLLKPGDRVRFARK